jgi:hypothetical protein
MEESIIPLKNIILSPRIVEAVKTYKPDFNEEEYTIISDGTFGLNKDRLESILNAMKNEIPLPPVDIRVYSPEKKAWRPKGQPEKIIPAFYTVTNGRHRTAGALILGASHIRGKVYM